MQKQFLIVDGYPRSDREALQKAGVTLAHNMYQSLLLKYFPEAQAEVLFPSDLENETPSSETLKRYLGILWTGCSLCVNDVDNPAVKHMIQLTELSYEIGIPSFGSCWGLQIAAVAAGGRVEANPKGRELGLARKIHLTPNGQKHPMFKGKPFVFDGFSSHDDIVVKMPAPEKAKSEILAVNSFSTIQAAAITYKNGTFWATQYHPEYTLKDMARLLVARKKKAIELGFFKNDRNHKSYIRQLESLAKNPQEKYFSWQLAYDEDVLDDSIRELEFINWIKALISL